MTAMRGRGGAKLGAIAAAMVIRLLVSAAPADAAVLYDQYDHASLNGTTSQDFEAANDALDDQAADDFVVPAGQRWTISGVDVQGQYLNCPCSTISVNVFFYANTGSNLPGTTLASRIGQGYTGPPNLSVNLTSPVTLGPGTYWVSVQARQDFSTGGQWQWADRTVVSNSGPAWQNPGGGWGTGCTGWTRKTSCDGFVTSDQVFRLNGTIQHTLTVTESGSGSGTVTSSPAGLDCGATCQAEFDQGSTVTLTATTAPGSTFAGWEGPCSGTGACQVTMDADQAVSATFTAIPPPPNTKITNANIDPAKRKAIFKFKAVGQSSSFQCELKRKNKGARVRDCTSPKRYEHLKKGRYTFKVSAKGPGGVDPTPAKWNFKIA